MSKGSSRRPAAVTQEEYARNWERAFLERKGREFVDRTLRDQHGRTWGAVVGDLPDAVVTDVTLNFSLECVRSDPAREEQQRKDGA